MHVHINISPYCDRIIKVEGSHTVSKQIQLYQYIEYHDIDLFIHCI